MTPDLLQAMTGCTPENAAKWADAIGAAMDEFEINTPGRQAAFIAQIAHETRLFRNLHELWGPTEAQLRYASRADLGNTMPEAIANAGAEDVGHFYRGHGLIQVTGYTNHLKAAETLGIDCAVSPNLLELPENAARSAGDYWRTRGLNEAADAGEFERITRRINGGLNGYADRCALWDRCQRAMAAA